MYMCMYVCLSVCLSIFYVSVHVCTYVCTVPVCVQGMGTLHTCIHPYLYTYICTYYTVTFPQHLAKLNSFNTLWAVVGVFLHFSIERLHQTWDEVPKAKKEVRNTSQSSAEQYTGFVIIPQYYFPIPSNFLNTAVP